MKRTLLNLSFLLTLIVVFSCNKKWKETTHVDFHFNITKSHSTDFLQITSGSITLNSFEFSGDRKKGGGVSFYDNIENGANLNFNNGNASASIYYDIPQGNYSRITLSLQSIDKHNFNNIQLNGIYIDSVGYDTIPVQFNINISKTISLNSKPSNGGSDIELVKDNATSCEITLNPVYWFSGILKESFHNAYTEYNLIELSPEHNSNLYEQVIQRMNDGNTAVFK